MESSKKHSRKQSVISVMAARCLRAALVFLTVLLSGSGPLVADCEDPLTVTFLAGDKDGYVLDGRELPTTPAADVALHLQNTFIGTAGYDGATIDRAFGHTITDLPPDICAARFRITVRQIGGGASNDTLTLQWDGGSVWTDAIADLSSGGWQTPSGETIELDLSNLPDGTDLLPSLADGHLDVIVQDDTSVDFIELELDVCPVSCVSPPHGLTGWWPFDDSSPRDRASDLAAMNHGRIDGATHVDGVWDDALSFDGINDFVEIPSDDDTNVTGDFTIDFWIRTEEAFGIPVVLDKRESESLGYHVYLLNGAVGLQLADGTFQNFSSSAFVADGEWHFVTITVDRDQTDGITFYLDCEELESFDPTARQGSLVNDEPLVLGRRNSLLGGYTEMEIDELELYQRALGPNEVQALCAGRKCRHTVNAPWDEPLCDGLPRLGTAFRLCNLDASPTEFVVGVEGTDCGPGTVVPDGISVSARGPVFVHANACRDVRVLIDRPAGLSALGGACWQATAIDLRTGLSATDMGYFYDSSDYCPAPARPFTPIVQDVPSTVSFSIRNTSAAPVTFPWSLEVMPSQEALGPSVDNPVVISPSSGEVSLAISEELIVEAELTLVEPRRNQRPYDVLLKNDALPDGTPAVASALAASVNGCTTDEDGLCLLDDRFRVEIDWVDFQGNTGRGRAVKTTSQSGYFWFFGEDNVEVIVKVLDGRPQNGHFWVFFGALSNIAYTLTVTDILTGDFATYTNEAGTFASVGDVQAIAGSASTFELIPASLSALEERSSAQAFGVGQASDGHPAKMDCTPTATSLCLAEERFQVSVEYRDFVNNTGTAGATPLTGDTGSFWFFSPENVELMVKVLDGRFINNRFWVFYAALSNIEYEVTVTDTETGRTWTSLNELGAFGSVGDTDAFPP